MRKPKQKAAAPELRTWTVTLDVTEVTSAAAEPRALRITILLPARSAVEAAETVLVASRGHWPPWWTVEGA